MGLQISAQRKTRTKPTTAFQEKIKPITNEFVAKKYKGQAVGIDLGTTYSCVAVWHEQHSRVEIIHNDQGNRTTPSCVAFTEEQRLIGDAAKNQAAANPQNTVFGNLISLLFVHLNSKI
jgi:hypothetical protein